MNENEIICKLNRIQEEVKAIKGLLTQKGMSRTITGFEKFWELYPRKINEMAARNEWNSFIKVEEIDVIYNALKNNEWPKEEKYVMSPERWLRNKRWLDQQKKRGDDGKYRDISTTI